MGTLLRKELNTLPGSVVKTVRGRGLLNAIVIDEKYDAMKVSIELIQDFSFSNIISVISG